MSTSAISWIDVQLGVAQRPHTIVHIGAGWGSELDAFLRQEPGHLYLIEPTPDAVRALRQNAANLNNVTVLQAAISDQPGTAELRLFNFPELNSLREPVGLYSLLPGLRQVGRVEVATLSARELIEQMPLKADGDNWLVLEAPGEELTILTALADCQALERFGHLIVRAGSEAFYDNTPSSSPAVLETLEQLGYTPQGQPGAHLLLL